MRVEEGRIHRSGERARAWRMVVAGALAIGVYAAPYLMTWQAIGRAQLPYQYFPDLYYYIGLSQLPGGEPEDRVNPWYHTPAQPSELGHRSFGRLTFAGLAAMRRWSGSWSLGVLAWTLLWTALIAVSLGWLLRQLLPDRGSTVPAVGLALILLANLSQLPGTLRAWLEFPDLQGFENLSLPYLRVPFPQVSIPLLCVYLALLARTPESTRTAPWVGMAAIQTVTLAVFPYATVLMAATTGVFAVGCFLASPRRTVALRFAAFGVACGVADGLYLSSAADAIGGVLGRSMLLRLDFSRLDELVGGTLGLLVVLSGIVLCLPGPPGPVAKRLCFSLGAATSCLLLSDLLVNPRLHFSQHFDYFQHFALGLQILCILRNLEARRLTPRLASSTGYLLVAGLVVHGVWTALATHRHSLTKNLELRQLAGTIEALGIGDETLVISPGRALNDWAAWIPLLTGGEVLYYSNAELDLSEEKRRSAGRLRQALYLYFLGKTRRQLEEALAAPGKDAQTMVPLLMRIPIRAAEGERLLAEFRRDLMSRFVVVDRLGAEAAAFFAYYDEIVVIDDADEPLFRRQRLADYLTSYREEVRGGFSIVWCVPRPAERGAIADTG